jgi:hypothetical protein
MEQPRVSADFSTLGFCLRRPDPFFRVFPQ